MENDRVVRLLLDCFLQEGDPLVEGSFLPLVELEQSQPDHPFLEGGGAAFYHSPIQPQPVQDTCLGPASWSNFVADRDYNISGYTSPYWSARMINLEWAQHRSGLHQMFPSSTGIEDVTSYALHRPDGNWSLLLVNRNENSPHAVRVTFGSP